MKGLGTQLGQVLRSRLGKAAEHGGEAIADGLAKKMKENTLSGTSYNPSNYKKTYSTVYKKHRAKQGLTTEPTIMRAKNKRIERTKIEKVTTSGAKIVFENEKERAGKSKKSASFGQVMRMHHEGTAKGGYTRQLFPYSKEHSLVPKDIVLQAKKAIHEALNGR